MCAAVWITTSRTDHLEQRDGVDHTSEGKVRSMAANSACSAATNCATDWTDAIRHASLPSDGTPQRAREYRRSTSYGEELPRTGHALKFMLPVTIELDSCSGDEVFHRPGDQDLARSRQRCDPGG